MTDGDVNEAAGVQTAEAQPGSGAASGSAPYADGYQAGRRSMERKLMALNLEIQRLKAKRITPDECADFLIRRAEGSAEGARILLGLPKTEVQNGPDEQRGANT